MLTLLAMALMVAAVVARPLLLRRLVFGGGGNVPGKREGKGDGCVARRFRRRRAPPFRVWSHAACRRALIEVKEDFSPKEIWSDAGFGIHFMMPIFKDGFIYGVHGHGPLDCPLVCVDAKDGKEKWRTEPEWEEVVQTAGGPRKIKIGFARASFTQVDGRTLVLTRTYLSTPIDSPFAGYDVRTLGTHPRPWTCSRLGFTPQTGPSKPASSRLRSTASA